MVNITINIESVCLGGGEGGPSGAPIEKITAFLNTLRGAVETARAHLEDQPEVDAEFDPESDAEPPAEPATAE